MSSGIVVLNVRWSLIRGVSQERGTTVLLSGIGSSPNPKEGFKSKERERGGGAKALLAPLEFNPAALSPFSIIRRN